MAAGVLAHDQPVAGNADRFRRHDFVGLFVLEHAVLMDARLVGKGVVADHRLIDRNRDARDLGHQARSRIELLAGNVRVEIEIVFSRAQRHHDFFQ